MDLINERFNDWDQEVIDVDYHTSLLLRRKLNNALDNMIPNQSHVLEKVHEKTRMFHYTDPVFIAVREYHMFHYTDPVFIAVREYHWNIYKEPRHG